MTYENLEGSEFKQLEGTNILFANKPWNDLHLLAWWNGTWLTLWSSCHDCTAYSLFYKGKRKAVL